MAGTVHHPLYNPADTENPQELEQAMSVPTLILERNTHTQHETMGTLLMPSGIRYQTIERPWKDNAKGISCIPVGEYDIKFTLSNRFKKHLYEVLNVPGRSGIRIHVANWAKELEGCIALGISRTPGMVVASQIAVDRFHNEMAGRAGKLIIRDV